MDDRYSIRLARRDELPALPDIERAAAALFAGYVHLPPTAEFTSPAEFERAQALGQLWIALACDVPVGFALVETLASGLPHLEEIDVAPSHARQGIGTALMQTVCAWVAQLGHPSITLTTFRHVPWNQPFYTRLGFEVIRPDAWSAELSEIVAHEAAHGLDPAQRVVMRYRVVK